MLCNNENNSDVPVHAENAERQSCKTIYFNGDMIPHSQMKYVCWLDIMGTKKIMSESVKKSANFIFKLHVALLESQKGHDGISLYPMMDGAYILSSSRKEITKFLSETLSRLAVNFSEEQDNRHRFLVRGALAFGPVYEGKFVNNSANYIFTEFESYKNSLILGMPIVQAFTEERKAPPFSIYICESARAFAPQGEDVFKCRWFKWQYQNALNKDFDFSKFISAGKEYFDYSKKHKLELEYDKSEEHQNMFSEFTEFFSQKN